MDERLERAPIGVLSVRADEVVCEVNAVAEDLLDAEGDVVGRPLATVAPRSVEDSLLEAIEGESVAETEFEEYYPDRDQWLAVSVVSTADGATVFLRDVTKRRREQRALERLRAERDRTAVVDDLVAAVLTDLVDATSREDIAQTVCRRLGDPDRYAFAWLGERELGGDDIVVSAAAGATGETFEAVRDALDGPETTPEERAIETGSLETVHPLPEADTVPESVRVAGFGDGVQSVLAIPLVYGTTVHGVVGVYASGSEGVSARERTSFEALGRVAGFAITAGRNRALLDADSVTAVTIEVSADSVLARLGAELGGSVTLDGLVPRGADEAVCFLTVESAENGPIEDVTSGVQGVTGVRVVSESATGGSLEVSVEGPTPLLAVASAGGTVREATAEDGTGQVVADLPQDGSVRRMVEAVTREFDATVVAKRERPQSVATGSRFSDQLSDALTDRQETALRTAYHADYFESPRGSTAAEVADALDITGSTLLHHLRAAQRKLLDAFFEAGAQTAPGTPGDGAVE